MTKRILPPKPHYLYFVTAVEDGWTQTRRLDLSSTPKANKIEALFDRLFIQRRQEKRKSDLNIADLYLIPYYVMDYLEYISESDEDGFRTADATLRACEDLGFPFHWTEEDWGKWDTKDADEWVMTEGKHYWYTSWW